ncbi:uncharacterized protein LOC106958212 isoform X4 [Poecilia latipinna]|uniref:uncharacterized protein LOC106958212 isoform X4 n=1 Tax=Poecilia latipinna TaxID=48699 RepID=UPI00072ED265|nr:PREDICTED: uncharacterized protein LOC106958212 isoform X4 [Poecilia latipinna]
MGKLLFAVVVAIASLALVESLICNKCSVSVFGFCLNAANMTCGVNETVCYTGKATFPAITGFAGFSIQGCSLNDVTCNKTTTSSLLGVSYNTEISCCGSDRCNTVTITSAAPAKMSAAITGAVLASVLGSML